MVSTLVIDCGGGGIKATVLDEAGTMRAQPVRVPTPYPLSTKLFVKTLVDLSKKLPQATHATVGLPGMIRHGVVVATPHYVTVRGPRSRVDPDLALFDGGHLAPHLEVSQAPVRWGLSYDTYIGEHERRRLGDSLWSRRVVRCIDGLRPMFMWDRLYLGGGNSRHITPSQVAKLGDDTVIVPNAAALVGGARAWQLHVEY